MLRTEPRSESRPIGLPSLPQRPHAGPSYGIRRLTSYGLLKAAFRPADRICELRSYVRQRARLTGDRSRCVQHLQKALTEMNVQLDDVLSDIMDKTGQLIVRVIVGASATVWCWPACVIGG